MNTKEILKTHNAWRRGDDTRSMDDLGFSVTELGMAIDDAVRAISERDQLVEALEWLRGAINCTPENDKHQSGAWISTKHPRIKQIDELLAAHRKQEAE